MPAATALETPSRWSETPAARREDDSSTLGRDKGRERQVPPVIGAGSRQAPAVESAVVRAQGDRPVQSSAAPPHRWVRARHSGRALHKEHRGSAQAGREHRDPPKPPDLARGGPLAEWSAVGSQGGVAAGGNQQRGQEQLLQQRLRRGGRGLRRGTHPSRRAVRCSVGTHLPGGTRPGTGGWVGG